MENESFGNRCEFHGVKFRHFSYFCQERNNRTIRRVPAAPARDRPLPLQCAGFFRFQAVSAFLTRGFP
ncbi:hypothetical protein C7S14_1166 [Burkholderia cepacia]|nr:hypothetical protein C7S14_1166 [Burkholderia cepacia]